MSQLLLAVFIMCSPQPSHTCDGDILCEASQASEMEDEIRHCMALELEKRGRSPQAADDYEIIIEL